MEKVNQFSTMNADDLKTAVFRLAHFDPSSTDQYGNQIIDYLVLDCLATYGLLRPTPGDIRSHIKRVFILEFEEAEIISSAKRLHRKEMIEYKEVSGHANPLIRISPETATQIQSNIEQMQALENDVIQQWKGQLIHRYAEYSKMDTIVEQIAENLKLFVSKMFIKHGIECVSILYPEIEADKKFLAAASNCIIDTLPTIDPYGDVIIRQEIPRFFIDADPKRKKYIISLLNSSFFLCLVQVDEKCSHLLRSITGGQKLYLDNNILYSLVGLHGPDMMKSVHNMLDMARRLGYELYVTTKTIDEFRNSLNWRLREVREMPLLPADLARIAIENMAENNFVTTYWSEFVETGKSIEDFVAEKSNIEEILKGLKISVTDEFRDEIEKSAEFVDEQSILRKVAHPGTSEHIIEHDAFHRIFIRKKRKGDKYRFHEAGSWFLTNDSKLPVYDKVARKGKECLSFCITCEQWVQVNRPLLMRTANQAEYDESFHTLVTHPMLRSMMPVVELDRARLAIVGRLAHYKNIAPQLALEIVSDAHFISTTIGESDPKRIDEKIENKFIDLARQLKVEKEALEKSGAIDRESIKKLQEDITRLNDAVSTMKQNQKSQSQRIHALSSELESERSEKQRIIQELNNEKQDKNKIKKEKDVLKLRFKWLLFAVCLVFTSSVIWLQSIILPWDWIDMHRSEIIIKTASQILVVAVLFNIPLPKHWKFWLGSIFIPILVIILIIACGK